MAVKPLVLQIAITSGSLGLILAALLLLGGHTRSAAGLLFGAMIGVINQAMIAFRVSHIGELGGTRRTVRYIQAGTGLRFVLIGAAASLALLRPGLLDFTGFVAGLLLTMVVGAVIGVRAVLR